MPKNIDSNLIVRTRLPAPTGTGLKQVVKELKDIDALLTKIQRIVTITVNVAGDSAILNQIANQGKGGNGKGGQGGSGQGGSGQGSGQGFGGSGGSPIVKGRTTSSSGAERFEQQFESTRGTVTRRRKEIQTINAKGDESTSTITKRIDLERQEEARRQSREAINQIRAPQTKQQLQDVQKDFLSQQLDLKKQGFQEDVSSRKTKTFELLKDSGEKATSTISTFTRVLADGSSELVTFNEKNNTVTEGIKKTTAASGELAREQKLLANQNRAAGHSASVLSQGFQLHKETFQTATVNGKEYQTVLKEFRKITGNPIFGTLGVEIANVSEATGEMTTRIVGGSEAIKVIGDRFTNAIAKVGLWALAITTLYGIARAAGEAVNRFKDLEDSTVFLARVGSNITGGQSDFSERIGPARELTEELINQNQILGGNSRESQQAASIFLRGQATKNQALEATTAAILASTIAELKLVNAAQLISSAQTQFGLSSAQLIPTLNSLNTLSNSYRVTTDDLLESVSRAGSVYASVNGTLEGLAATTAVVAQRTRRTGAEIGNALKTIISRLSAPETSGALIEMAGIVPQDAKGQLKDFTSLLLELNTALVESTDLESNRIQVQIAGARQVNILKNALEGVIDIVLAEVKALEQRDTAFGESIQQSTTLKAALGRLSASFDAIVYSGSSAGEVINSFANTLNFVLKLANVFDGLLIKIGLLVAVFAVVKVALIRYTSITSTVIGSNIALASSFTQIQANAAASAASLLKLNLASLGIVAVFTATTYAISKWEEASARASIEALEAVQKLNQEGASLDRQSKSVDLLTKALVNLIETRRRLNDLRLSGNADLDKERKNAEDIKRITGSLNNLLQVNQKPLVPELGEVDLQNPEKLNQLVKLFGENQRKANEAAIEGKKQAIAFGKKEAEQLLEKIKKSKEVLELQKKIEHPFTEAFIGLLGFEGSVGLAKEIKKDEQAFNDLEESIQNNTKEIEDLIERGKQIPIAYSDAVKKSIQEIERLIQAHEDYKKSTTAASQLSTGNFLGESFNSQKLKDLVKAQKELGKEIAFVSTETKDGYNQLNRMKDALRGVRDEAIKLAQAMKADEIKKLSSFFGERQTAADSVHRAVAIQHKKLQLARAQEDGSSPSKFDQFEINKAEINISRARALQQQKELNSVVLNRGNVLDDETRIAKANSLQAAINENLNKARELELGQVKEILDIELDITKEKIKQRQEISAALGLLDTEQKLSLLSEITRPDFQKKVGFEQQFFAGQEFNRVNQQFLPGRLEKGFNPKNPFDQLFIDKGVGIQRETQEADEELQKRFRQRGGPVIPETNEELLLQSQGESRIESSQKHLDDLEKERKLPISEIEKRNTKELERLNKVIPDLESRVVDPSLSPEEKQKTLDALTSSLGRRGKLRDELDEISLDKQGIIAGQSDLDIVKTNKKLRDRLQLGLGREGVLADPLQGANETQDILERQQAGPAARRQRDRGTPDPLQQVRDAENINLEVRPIQIDFNPLVDAFRNAVTVQLLDMQNDLIKQITEIYDLVHNNPAFKNEVPQGAQQEF